MIGPERVLEARVGSAGINQESKAELADVSQTLKYFVVDEPNRKLVDTNVIPERVAERLESQARPRRLAGRSGVPDLVSCVAEFPEIGAEHLGEFLRLLVVLRAVAPRAARVEHFRGDTGDR